MATGLRAVPAPKVTWSDVFSCGEYRALWAAQVISIGGDQFARVALAVLVYNRTRSPLLAAVTFAATTGAMTAGALCLSWTADRWPRRAVMVTCDVACAGLVGAMLIPGLPLGVLIGLLFAASLALEPFLAARMAVNRAVLGGRFRVGMGITLATYQAAQLAGLAAGGFVAAAAGIRGSLVIDAASFAVSAVIVAVWVGPHRPEGRPARDVLGGFRVVFGAAAPRTAMLVMCLVAVPAAAEGVAVPLARALGGGTVTVGWLLAAITAGSAAGPPLWTRFVPESRQDRLAVASAGAGCAVLVLFTLPVQLAAALALFVAAGLGTGYVATAGDVLFGAVDPADHGKASGVVGAVMSAAQAVAVITAGAAAQRFAPALVVAAFGLAGTLAAIPLAAAWRRARPA